MANRIVSFPEACPRPGPNDDADADPLPTILRRLDHAPAGGHRPRLGRDAAGELALPRGLRARGARSLRRAVVQHGGRRAAWVGGDRAARGLSYQAASGVRRQGLAADDFRRGPVAPGPVFLKPPNQKTFPARVYASGTELPEMPDGDPVLVSEPVEWAAEFRFFVRDRRVLAWSPYWLHGALARDGDEWVIESEMAATTRGLVNRLLADPRVDLPPALVLDAGVIRGVGPAVVEANEASGSGLYGCDPREVLDHASRGEGPACGYDRGLRHMRPRTMPWRVVERKIGRAGGLQQKDGPAEGMGRPVRRG